MISLLILSKSIPFGRKSIQISNNVKMLLKILIAILVILSTICMSYRFKNPEKTETQLFLDLLKGKVFKL